MKNSKSTTLPFLRSVTHALAFLFIILLSISCTKVEEIPSVISSVKNENFVDISLAKQIAANLKFIESTKTTNSIKKSSNAFF
ncbi:hypothetical protein [Flectobacillus roseus]|uniref:hypothetical protein n=1 Tax=Flectobacillus roseus TaxID=502259 RepID=UPI0024B75C27|nr:hypothetical protein [Flectobacillus roseus]MDI9871689.1 hypothetical protein [Flectobacillus roseus]